MLNTPTANGGLFLRLSLRGKPPFSLSSIAQRAKEDVIRNLNLKTKGGENKKVNKYLLKLGTAISSAALVASSFVGPALALNIEISGNGVSSNSTVNFNSTSNTSVNQSNNASITNNVDVNADTGNNTANNNTGGNVNITTGNADANATVNNTANANWASVDPCCQGDVNVTIKDNGAGSDNDAIVKLNNTVNVTQDNNAKVKNNVDVDANTGKNDANNNTGGDVSIETGDANASATVENSLNTNGAVISGDGGGTLSIEISGNGANSDNTVNVNASSSVKLEQTNYAKVKNDVDVDADTGNNTANNNTGGNVTIDTGNADANADVSTLANFNWADLDACGCPLDGTVKISGNGVGSDNDVVLELVSLQLAGQDNNFKCKGYGYYYYSKKCNDVDVDADTGSNDANKNTQGSDPLIVTGDASSNAYVETEVNVNVLNGDVEPPALPDLIGELIALLEELLALLS